jgi:hypothetical protein
MNAGLIAGAKSETDEDDMTSVEQNHVVAIARNPHIKASPKNINAYFLVGAKADPLDVVHAWCEDVIGEQDCTSVDQDTGETSRKRALMTTLGRRSSRIETTSKTLERRPSKTTPATIKTRSCASCRLPRSGSGEPRW